MTLPFTFLLRVRYGECDAQMVVFNARYGDYADLAATEFLRASCGGLQALLARGLDLQVAHYSIDWKAPARFDDVLGVRVHARQVGKTSLRLGLDFYLPAGGVDVAQATLVYVMVTNPGFAKTAVPDDLRTALLQGAPGVVVDQAGIVGT